MLNQISGIAATKANAASATVRFVMGCSSKEITPFSLSTVHFPSV
jgi:hypothetical protein